MAEKKNVFVPVARKGGAPAQIEAAHVPLKVSFNPKTMELTTVQTFDKAPHVSSKGNSFIIAYDQAVIPGMETPEAFELGGGLEYRVTVTTLVNIPKGARTRYQLQAAEMLKARVARVAKA